MTRKSKARDGIHVTVHKLGRSIFVKYVDISNSKLELLIDIKVAYGQFIFQITGY